MKKGPRVIGAHVSIAAEEPSTSASGAHSTNSLSAGSGPLASLMAVEDVGGASCSSLMRLGASISSMSGSMGARALREQSHMPLWQAEEEQEEWDRVHSRVTDAVEDPTGRLKLFLENSNTPYIPDEVGRITTLRELYMDSCRKVRYLPITISKLCDTLQIIDASNCSIVEIPEEFAFLHSLKRLNLRNNQLESFLWDPRKMTSLEQLDISHNKIQYLSYLTRELLERLMDIERKAAATKLHAERALAVEDNHWLGPTSFPSNEWELSSVPRQSPLSEMLPPHVEHCLVCGDLVQVGRPLVFVKFQEVMVKLPKPSQMANRPNPVRVPFFFPYCPSGDCCMELHRIIAREKFAPRSL